MEDPKAFSAPITAFNGSSASANDDGPGTPYEDAKSEFYSEYVVLDKKVGTDSLERESISEGAKSESTVVNHGGVQSFRESQTNIDNLEKKIESIEKKIDGIAKKIGNDKDDTAELAQQSSDLEANVTTSSTTSDGNGEKEIELTDPNIVDWDGPDDPTNPMNWPQWKVKAHIFLVSAITFIR